MSAPPVEAGCGRHGASSRYAYCSAGCGRRISRGRLTAGICSVCAGERHPCHPAEELLEDAQWLADAGETWAAVLDRLGVTSAALERALYRHSRSDLLRRLRGQVTR